MVAGLVTLFDVKEGRNSGEKVAFMTLEDYSGSYSFRLGDRDYMKLKDQLDEHRFVILKVKYTISKDQRVYLNVVDVIELKEALEKFAKSISVVMPLEDLRKEDLEFFKNNLQANNGDMKIQFYVKNEQDRSFMELHSLKSNITINEDVLQLMNNYNKYEFFLN